MKIEENRKETSGQIVKKKDNHKYIQSNHDEL